MRVNILPKNKRKNKNYKPEECVSLKISTHFRNDYISKNSIVSTSDKELHLPVQAVLRIGNDTTCGRNGVGGMVQITTDIRLLQS